MMFFQAPLSLLHRPQLQGKEKNINDEIKIWFDTVFLTFPFFMSMQCGLQTHHHPNWTVHAHNTRTLITQVNLAQIILSVFYILTYFIPHI